MEYPELNDSTRDVKILFSKTTSFPEIINWLDNTGFTDSTILIPEKLGKEVKRSFPLNSRLVAHAKKRTLSIQLSEATSTTTTVLQNESAHFSVQLGTVKKFVTSSDNGTITSLRDEFDQLVESAEEIVFDVPPINELLNNLEESVDSSTREEFERLIQAAQIENLGKLDEYSVALIAAAQSGALFYDISKWGEDVGLGSKASFSRRKTSLEEDGVLYTTSVPVDIGRPKDRLHLSDDLSGINIEIGINDHKLGISKNNSSDPDTSTESQSEDKSQAKPDPHKESNIDNNNNSDILDSIEEEIENAIRSN